MTDSKPWFGSLLLSYTDAMECQTSSVIQNHRWTKIKLQDKAGATRHPEVQCSVKSYPRLLASRVCLLQLPVRTAQAKHNIETWGCGVSP